ncbi:FG-GAP-like repeat-containing protein [Leucobacter sp.]
MGNRRGSTRAQAMVLAAALLIAMPVFASSAPATAVGSPADDGSSGQESTQETQTPDEGQGSPDPDAPDAGDPLPETPDGSGDAGSGDPGDTEGVDELDGPRGPDGGLASDSPGPATAKPWDGSEPGPLTHAAGRGAVLGDDYPAKYKNIQQMQPPVWDEWNFAHRQCTSFVAWRLNSANGVGFSNQYGGVIRWGDAGQWKATAESLGIRVDTRPEVGAVAWSGPGYGGASQFGHVAWVAQVLDNGNIVIEEYNNGWLGAYGTRTVAPSAFQGYIHIKDMTKPFTKTSKPTISGAPMLGGALTAAVSGWQPAPTNLRYRWFRDGTAISGASGASYQPMRDDLGASISVEVTGDRPGYTATGVLSSSTTAVLMIDANGNGVDDTQEMLPWDSDMNGDGLPDAVGFSANGVQVALRSPSGLGAARTWGSGFGTAAGWGVLTHPRALIDVNGDGMADVVGFASGGVYVSTSTGSELRPATRWSSQFGSATGWDVRFHPRTLADVNGDGLPDVVGFAAGGVYVALGTGTSFGAMQRWYAGFGSGTGSTAANSWWVDNSVRFVADMNGDGRADIVGISTAGVYVALSTGSGFAKAQQWSTAFRGNDGWRVGTHPRTLADVDGDGRLDVVGFASGGVYVALNSGSGLQPVSRWVSGFGTSAGWQTGRHPRTLADVNGDGRADVVGFGADGAVVSLSSGSGFSAPARWSGEFGAGSWLVDRHPRMVVDVNGDGRADIVGFGADGQRVALSTGRAFGTSRLETAAMGFSSGWRVAAHPRMVGVQRLTRTPVPVIAGQPGAGQTLRAPAGKWRPAPVQLSYQWNRNGSPIRGATGESYRLTSSDIGRRITVTVTGERNAYDSKSLTSTVVKVPGTPPLPTSTPFADVGASHKFYREIAWMHTSGMSTGVKQASGKPRYQPGAGVSREAMAAFLFRLDALKTYRAPSASPFRDVGVSHKFYREIAWMRSSGLSTGIKTSSGTVYDASSSVSREAMAAFLYRLEKPSGYRPPTTSPFADVPTSHKFYREIAWMHETGLSTGIKQRSGKPKYAPKDAVSREAMAAFLYRLETRG